MDFTILLKEVSDLLLTNLQDFCEKEDLNELSPELSFKMIEQTRATVSQIGCKTLKYFFESFDTCQESIQEKGELYRFKYEGEREFLTSVGKVRIKRSVYQRDKGGKSIVPLDRYWNMENQYMSIEVQEALLYSCAHNTPEETSRLLQKTSILDIHPTTIKKLINETGGFVEEHKDSIIEQVHQKEELGQGADVMVCSLDGVNVLLNEKGKKKGRPKERPDKCHEDSEKSSYKNAMCGTVSYYNIETDKKSGKKSACRVMTKYVSRMPEDRFPEFKKEFEKEITHCSTTNPIKKILLTDGHKSLQGYIKDNPKFAGFEWMFDFFHAAEHLSKLAGIIFGKSSAQGQKWYTQKRDELKNSKNGAVKVIRSAEYYITALKTKKAKEDAIKELNYFKKHKKMMNYKLHIDNGWPIGSGVVEAACKSVVKQRMCRSGQRWTRQGGQKILNLRTYVKSQRWDLFWNSYKEMQNKNAA